MLYKLLGRNIYSNQLEPQTVFQNEICYVIPTLDCKAKNHAPTEQHLLGQNCLMLDLMN